MQEKGKKIKIINGVVVKATQETPDTWTLDIFVDDQHKDYKAGQFISINPHQFPELRDFINYFEGQKSKVEPIRAYSLTSAPHEKYISITIKPENYHPGPDAYPPLLSPFLASDIMVGREIEFTGYAGAYIIPDDLRPNTDHLIHLVAGSGVVPSFSIIKDELLGKKSSFKHTLVSVNKTKDDIIFHRQLEELRTKFPERFQVYYFLTRDEKSNDLAPHYFMGRPKNEFIEQLVMDKAKTLFFACGPALTKWQKKAAQDPKSLKPRFMEWVQDIIYKMEIDRHRFRREIYG